jgi:hypothetical protein
MRFAYPDDDRLERFVASNVYWGGLDARGRSREAGFSPCYGGYRMFAHTCEVRIVNIPFTER